VKQISIPAHSIGQSGAEAADLKLIPYYAWNNRGASKMMVWLPQTEALVHENYYIVADFISTVTASHTYGGDGSYGPESTNAMIDGMLPSSSSDESIPRWTTWPQTGVAQNVVFVLKKATDIRSFSVYWYQDKDGVRVPQSWNLQYKEGDAWKDFPVYITDTYATERDKFNIVHPSATIVTNELRLNITPDATHAAGILEVIIEEN
jgi:hypothetical protein